MVLDHLCRNRACMNSDHMEVVTRGENVRRGFPFRQSRTVCLHGHAMEGDNVLMVRDRGRTYPICAECRRKSAREWARTHRAALKEAA